MGKVVTAAELGLDPVEVDAGLDAGLNLPSHWKLWYDNGTECYHCPTVHRQSFGAAYDTGEGFTDWGTWDTLYGSHFTPTRRWWAGRTAPSSPSPAPSTSNRTGS